jgi:hypothetical protein
LEFTDPPLAGSVIFPRGAVRNPGFLGRIRSFREKGGSGDDAVDGGMLARSGCQ